MISLMAVMAVALAAQHHQTREMTTTKITLLLLGIGIVSIAAGLIWDIPLCLLYNITGVPCPSCGLTRAFLFAAQGNIAMAFWYHPLWILVLLLPILFSLQKKLPSRAVSIGAGSIFAIFILVWLIRLFTMFPETEPMVFHKKSLFYWLYQNAIK